MNEWYAVWKQKQMNNRLKKQFTGNSKGKFNRGRVVAWLAGLAFGAVLLGIVTTLVLFVYFSKDLPSPDKVVRREGFATKIYDRNDQLLYDVYADQRRTPVDISQIPMVMRQATISIEDKNFYKHAGVDPLTPFRIAWNVVTKHRVIGGSTLTQQLVKNTILTQERTLTRKLKEFILTLQVEQKYSKDQILQMYLNENPYGGTAWGVESASELYFNKPISQVNLPEAAILAGLPQSPTQYSPYNGDKYIGRAYDVLRRMHEDGYITADQEKEARTQVEQMKISPQSGLLKAPHFVFYIKQKLIEKYGERAVEQGGLRVTTTLDLNLQEAAQQIVSEEINKVKYLNITNGAAVVLDPKTGQILAMVGSRDWGDPDYDGKYNVTLALRQPGSSIKPVVYLTGLREGYTAGTLLMDVKTAFPGGDQPEYIPENYDGKFRGPVLVRDALGNSLNIPAVKMVALVGIKNMLQMGFDMGFTTLEPTSDRLSKVGLAVALGGGEVKLLDESTAYSAFANGGKKVDPIGILKVSDNSGKVLEEWKPESVNNFRQVITPQEAFIISNILSDAGARQITFGLHSQLEIPNRQVAVKTGTTNDKKDNWTVGWAPNVMVGVWVGNNNNTPMKQVASGITGASPIWRRIILKALENKPNEQFTKPDGLVEMDIDKISGFKAHDGFDAKKEIFIKGTEPTGDDPVHKKIKVCKGEGKLANPADVGSGNYDEKEAFYFKEEDPFQALNNNQNKWQEGILNWLKDQADPKYHPPTDYCGNSNPVWITILTPADKSHIDGNDINIKVDVGTTNNTKRVEFYLDGQLKYTVTTAPWEITLPNVADGNHKVDVKAVDDKNNEGTRHLDLTVGKVSVSPAP